LFVKSKTGVCSRDVVEGRVKGQKKRIHSLMDGKKAVIQKCFLFRPCLPLPRSFSRSRCDECEIELNSN
jgi:hypothetical protein